MRILNVPVGNHKEQLASCRINVSVIELVNSWSTESPHILYLTEHHLHNQEINNTCIQQYKLGASYCRMKRKGGGVSIYVHDSLTFSTI